MSTEHDGDLEATAALGQAQRIEEIVHRRGRWHGWVWLVVGLATPAFLVGGNADSFGDARLGIALAFMVVGGALAIWETRRGLWGKEAARADRPVTWAYATAVVAIAVVTLIVDISSTPAWFVALAFVPSVPCFVAAWRILTR